MCGDAPRCIGEVLARQSCPHSTTLLTYAVTPPLAPPNTGTTHFDDSPRSPLTPCFPLHLYVHSKLQLTRPLALPLQQHPDPSRPSFCGSALPSPAHLQQGQAALQALHLPAQTLLFLLLLRQHLLQLLHLQRPRSALEDFRTLDPPKHWLCPPHLPVSPGCALSWPPLPGAAGRSGWDWMAMDHLVSGSHVFSPRTVSTYCVPL